MEEETRRKKALAIKSNFSQKLDAALPKEMQEALGIKIEMGIMLTDPKVTAHFEFLGVTFTIEEEGHQWLLGKDKPETYCYSESKHLRSDILIELARLQEQNLESSNCG